MIGPQNLDTQKNNPLARLAENAGIPRLQELSFLEIAALAVASRSSFEEVRLKLVAHMIRLREANPGTGNIATFQLAMEKPTRYVRNASEALKELMRLRLVARATLPSTASAAKVYRNTTFALTRDGEVWVEQLREDPRKAYDRLMTMLWSVHPQFAGYVRVVAERRLVVPLAQWNETPPPRSKERFADFLVSRVAKAMEAGDVGWSATHEDVRRELNQYLASITARAEDAKADPYPRNQDFLRTCEEALVKFAFKRCGLNLDYISQEILRRWTKELGIANFSYHVPGPPALRYWSTATLSLDGPDIGAARRVGADFRDQVLDLLAEAYDAIRRHDPSISAWVPIYRLRAHVCWRLCLSDAVFDRALFEFLAGTRGAHLPFRLNLDPAQYGSVPPTELPLKVEHAGRYQTYYSLSLVANRDDVSAP
jgi:hypothetical protein